MIVDPIVNNLDPPPQRQGYHSTSGLSAGANTKLGEVNIRGGTSPNSMEGDLPPPYTEIDLERGITEGLETPYSIHGRFMGRDEGNANDHQGIRYIKEGTQVFFNSVTFIIEASLLTLGTSIEGIGKIIIGFGMIMKPRETLCHPIPEN